MTPEEHRALAADVAQGRLLVGIDRTVARQFFTRLSVSEVAAMTGERLHVEMFIVKAQFILAGVLPFVAACFAIAAFGWWAVLIAPATLLVSFLFFASSTRGEAGLGVAYLLLATALILFFQAPWSTSSRWWLLALAGGVFFGRRTYVSAAGSLRSLVIRNHRAFEQLSDTAITLRHTSPT